MRFFKLWVGIAMVASLVLGITLGHFVLGDSTPVEGGSFLPGSPQDPLVTASYISQAVEERTASLESQIRELEQQVINLANTVEMLEAQLGRAASSQTQTGQTQTELTTRNTINITRMGSNSAQANRANSSNTEYMEVVAPTGLNVRTGPGTNYEIISRLPNGTGINVVSETAGWYEIVMSGGGTGWVHGDFVR